MNKYIDCKNWSANGSCGKAYRIDWYKFQFLPCESKKGDIDHWYFTRKED